MVKKSLNAIYVVLGFIFLSLGVIGIFLPLLPTTPFIILSAYFFSKGQKRLHNWLLTLPKIGMIINDWEQYGVISKKSKILASIMIIVLFSYTLIFVQVNLYIKIVVALIGISVLVFILSRPSVRKVVKI